MPENPLRLVTLMDVVFDVELEIMLIEPGLELMLKAGIMTATTTVVVFVVELLVPPTVTV